MRDYHSIDHDDQEPDHKTIESLLSQIEGEQAELAQLIINTKEINTSHIVKLAEFISLMKHRVPAFATHVETSHKGVVLDTFKIMYKSGKLGTPPKVIRQMFESKGVDKTICIKISNWKIIAQMLEIGLSPESINLLSQLKYWLYPPVA